MQHYESLYHGEAAAVDATYRLPLRKIVISTWLSDVMRERFDSEAEILVTPVDPALFHTVPVTVQTSRPRVLMLHHEYAWKGTADGFAAVARVKGRIPALHLVGFGVSAPRGPAGRAADRGGRAGCPSLGPQRRGIARQTKGHHR